MNISETAVIKLENIEEMGDNNSESNDKVCDIENKCSSENIVTSEQNLQTVDNNDQGSNKEDNDNIQQNAIKPVDDVAYNRKIIRQKSRRLTKLLQDHEKMLRKSYNMSMKQIYKCKTLTDFTDKKYILIVSNLPNFWSTFDIKHYIEAECGGPIKEIEAVKNCGLHEVVKLTFHSMDEAKDVMDKLLDKEVEGLKICVELKVVKDESEDDNMSNVSVKTNSTKWRPDLDIWDIDPKGLYGLKLQFLKSLGINPPIDKWVNVSNFRCEKSELREVLELAGHVLMITVTNYISGKRAKVMYSHPLEAVQAMSMLNGQSFYGLTLKLEMDRCPNGTTVLPKGLTAIGAGLGEQGKPLRNVVKHYKRFINGESSSVNQLLFSTVGDDKKCIKKSDKAEKTFLAEGNMTEKFGSVSVQTKNVTELFGDETNQTSVSTAVNADKVLPTALIPSNDDSPSTTDASSKCVPVATAAGSQITTVRPSTSSYAGIGNPVPLVEANFPVCTIPRQTRSPQNLQPAAFRPALVQVGLMPVASNPRIIRSGLVNGPSVCTRPVGLNPGTFSVQMSNLPLTTTFPLLYEKLSVCGQVLSLRFTTPGCAVATFANLAQAERASHQFNMLNVDGHVINAVLL